IDGYKGGVSYDANDRFCLDGERLIGVGGGENRTEHESFIRIFSSGPASDPTSFSIRDKDGGERGCGTAADSRIDAQGQSIAGVWAISYARDKNLNRIDYTYAEDNANGDSRPASISYTTNAPANVTTAANSVSFTFLDRSDVAPTY